jgi:hypothetical protein
MLGFYRATRLFQCILFQMRLQGLEGMWTEQQMEKAMMEFTVPQRPPKCMVIATDFFDCDLLSLSNNKEKFGTEKWADC